MKTVLITGGSSGIGFELSRLFAQDQYRLLWLAKTEVELQEAAAKIKKEFKDVDLHYRAQDLSISGAAQLVYDWVKKNWEIDVLVNNAGFGTFGFIQEIAREKELAMLQLNVFAVYELSRFFLSDMLLRNSGNIVNISSNTSLQPVPKMSTYAATKAFVKHFSESLSEELRYQKSKVRITVVCPSAIGNTQFQKNANMQNIRTFNSLLSTSATEVAKDTYRGMKKGKRVVYTGTRLRASLLLQKILPNFIVRAMLKRELEEL